MQYPKLELHITQLERLIANSRSKFTNKKKERIYRNLLLLFDSIKNSDYLNFNSDELGIATYALNVVFSEIEFLDYKNESEIPQRLIYCLNKVLNDWITNGTDEYFIVVSYNKTPKDFSVMALDAETLLLFKNTLKTLFNADYNQSLIKISKPKYLAEDYLSSIPLYHELGHFIDKNYQIVANFSREPGFSAFGISPIHFSEFFADLFAAQYIGKSAVAPLDETRTKAVTSHPSNAKRVELVNTFVEGTGAHDCMSIIEVLKRVTLLRTDRELKIRYENLTNAENPFIQLTPKIISDQKKLHALFITGWQNWMNPDSIIRKKYVQYQECSMAINKLIRNSIKLTMQQEETNRLRKASNYLENIAKKIGFIDN